MTSTTGDLTSSVPRQQGGPPPLIPAIAYAVFAVASLVLGAGGTRPDMSAAQVTAYDLAHPGLLGVLATVVFAGAVPLAIWSATLYQRLRYLGITAPGTAIALSGGIMASASLTASGLATWTAVQSADASEPGLAHALTGLAFAGGGPGFVVPFALLMLGIAIPLVITRLVPRWLGIAGLVIAAVGMIATFTLLTSALYPLLPIARFGGLLWIIGVSVYLPRTRRTSAAAATE